MSKNLSRRAFLRMVAAFATSGAVTWGLGEAKADTPFDIGVDLADPGADETVIFSGLDIDQPFYPFYPFYPYYVEDPASVFFVPMEDGDTLGLPDEREI